MLLWETLTLQRTEEGPSGADDSSATIVTRRLPFDRRCAAMTKAGKRCRGKIREGTEFCPFHDPTLSDKRRQALAAKGGRSHHRLARLPDGYLRKLTSRSAIGHAMDRLYREVRLGVVTPQMGTVLFNILTRLLDSGLSDEGAAAQGSPRSSRSKADRVRPKLSQLLTHAERRAWREAVASAPASFVRNHQSSQGAASIDRSGTDRREENTHGRKVALPAAS